MKNLLPRFFVLIALACGLQTVNAQSDLIITAVFDGNMPGQLPKGIELYVLNDIPDMSIYGVGSANNGGGTDGQEFTFPADSYSAGSFIYLASEAPQFTSFFGFAPTYVSNAVNINGDDAIELFMDGAEVDVFGEIEYETFDGSWNYDNGWAYRVDGTGPDGTIFIIENWTLSGSTALAGATTNQGANIPVPVGTYTPLAIEETIVSFESAALSVEESHGELTITITIINPDSSATAVEVAVIGGTAVEGVDFEFDSPQWVVFPAGSSENQSVTLLVLENDVEEGDRTIELALQNPENNAVIGMGELVITILDDDVTIPYYDIATLRAHDENGVPLLQNEYCETRGIVHGINMRPSGLQFTIIDPTHGIGVFNENNNLGYTVNEGDSIRIFGTVDFYNGLAQIAVDSVAVLASGLDINVPVSVTELNEDTESNVVALECVSIVDSTQWTGSGSGFNVGVTNGIDTFQVRVSSAVDLYNLPAPEGVFNIAGIGGQFDNSSPYFDGYQLLPRYSTDVSEPSAWCATSVKDLPEIALLVYPNPAVDVVNVASDENLSEIRLIDLNGRLIQKFNANGQRTVRISVSDLPSGMYLMQITTESGRLVREFVKP